MFSMSFIFLPYNLNSLDMKYFIFEHNEAQSRIGRRNTPSEFSELKAYLKTEDFSFGTRRSSARVVSTRSCKSVDGKRGEGDCKWTAAKLNRKGNSCGENIRKAQRRTRACSISSLASTRE